MQRVIYYSFQNTTTTGVSHTVSSHFTTFFRRFRKLLCLRCLKKTYPPTFFVSLLVGPVRTFEDPSFEVIENDLPLIITCVKATA